MKLVDDRVRHHHVPESMNSGEFYSLLRAIIQIVLKIRPRKTSLKTECLIPEPSPRCWGAFDVVTSCVSKWDVESWSILDSVRVTNDVAVSTANSWTKVL